MDTPATLSFENIEWLGLRLYLDRECEVIWRMQFNVPKNVVVFGGRQQRLARFRKESYAADRVAEEIEIIEAVAGRLGVGAKTANGPKNTWCFLFSPSGQAEPVFLVGLGEACNWLRTRSERLRRVSA